MKIRWERILGVLSLVVFVYVSVRLRPFVGHLFEVANQDYDYHNPIKAIMLGVLCLTLLAAIKLLIRR
jgi:hypothetical protein